MISPLRRALLAGRWPTCPDAAARSSGCTVVAARRYLSLLTARTVLVRGTGETYARGPIWAAWRDRRPRAHIGGRSRAYRARPPADPRGERSVRKARAGLLVQWRQAKGISRRQLAKRLGVSTRAVSNWEAAACGHGRFALTAARLQQIREVLQ